MGHVITSVLKMFPAYQGFNLNIEAISGICGSISIACWVVVFSPQIIEHFRRGSADGLSLQFIIIWLVGDIFNVLGSVLQGLLPTMIILAVYYIFMDIVLLGQVFYYRGLVWGDKLVPTVKPVADEPSERTGLLVPNGNSSNSTGFHERERRWSNVDASHLSPATPLLDVVKASDPPEPTRRPMTSLQTILFNLLSILLVFAAGVLGWWLSKGSSTGAKPHRHPKASPEDDDQLEINLVGQIFGILCAVFYLGSRIPQILLNYRRRSTEGISMLFFMFACLGNLAYVLAIFAFEAKCHGRHGRCEEGEAGAIYRRYILINSSWIAGSLGTLFLDIIIFTQFFVYQPRDEETIDQEYVESGDGVDSSRNDRPLLSRGDSEFE